MFNVDDLNEEQKKAYSRCDWCKYYWFNDNTPGFSMWSGYCAAKVFKRPKRIDKKIECRPIWCPLKDKLAVKESHLPL